MMRTYQTRLLLDAELTRQFDAYADLYGRAERTLFAEAARGKDLDQLKPGFCSEFGLTARQYNALSRSVKGKIESLVEIRKLRIEDLEDHLTRLEQVVAKLPAGSLKRHRKRDWQDARSDEFFVLGSKEFLQHIGPLDVDLYDAKIRGLPGLPADPERQWDLPGAAPAPQGYPGT